MLAFWDVLPPLYSRLIWKSLIDCTWSSGNFLFFLPSFSPEVHFLQSHQLPYLSPHYFCHSVYFLYILHCCCFAQFHAALHPHNMFHQQLCVNSGAVSLTLHHNIRHVIHKNGTLYLYRTKDGAKLMVDIKQSCLLWKAGSCLNLCCWLRTVLPRPWKKCNRNFSGQRDMEM